MLQICGVIELIRSEEVTPPPPQLLIFLPSTILAEREIMIDITHTSGTIRLTMTSYYPPTRASLWLLSSSPVPFNQHMWLEEEVSPTICNRYLYVKPLIAL